MGICWRFGRVVVPVSEADGAGGGDRSMTQTTREGQGVVEKG